MKTSNILPKQEALRRAVGWLLEQPVRDQKTIEEASVRFNLTPIDEDFLLNNFHSRSKKRIIR